MYRILILYHDSFGIPTTFTLTFWNFPLIFSTRGMDFFLKSPLNLLPKCQGTDKVFLVKYKKVEPLAVPFNDNMLYHFYVKFLYLTKNCCCYCCCCCCCCCYLFAGLDGGRLFDVFFIIIVLF